MAAAPLSAIPIEDRTVSLTEEVRKVFIVDQASYDAAGRALQAVIAMRNEIIGHHAEPKRKAHEAHKAICDAEARLLRPVQELEKTLKAAIARYELEQDRKRETEERQATAQAERAALELQEQAIVAAELAGASSAEVAALCSAPLIVPQVETARAQRPDGIRASKTYCVDVTDLRALARAVAEGTAPEGVIEPNMKALNRMAVALKGALNVPGVKVQMKFIVSGREGK
jgi:hypothetical protein